MRLTADLINNSLTYLNPLKERELDLRGHKIPAIENLGIAKDHESIDLTDNDISMLSNFPLSPRLQTLLLARNRISSIQTSLAKSIPNLRTLVLTENQLSELAELEPLQRFRNLTHLTLLENPVTTKEYYRYYVLWCCPSVRFLDFQKVKEAERTKGKELFGSYEEPTELAKSIVAVRSGGGAGLGAGSMTNGVRKTTKMKITEKEKQRFQALVNQAQSLSEVQKLEKAFAEGRLPAGVGEEDEVMEGS